MEHLFFNHEKDLENISREIFSLISNSKMKVGESSNVLDNKYMTLFKDNLKITIELNSYDYEDDYDYMLTVKEDFTSGAKTSKKYLKKMIDDIGRLIFEEYREMDLVYEDDNQKLVKISF